MKKINLLIIFSILLFSTSSCKDFFDVNEPTNVIPDKDHNLDLLMPTLEYHVHMLQYSKAFPMGQLQQHTASYFEHGVDQHYETSMAGVWSRYYTKILVVVKKMHQIADKEGAKHYKGMVQILDALSLGMIADTYGDIPYSDAGYGNNNLNPDLDNQQALYDNIQNLLDEGIANLAATDNTLWNTVKGDIVYYGDLGKWTRLAYTLKARYAMHLSKVNGVQAAQDALTYLANGFTSNSDDFQLAFTEKNKNPWHTSVVLAAQTSNLSVLFSEQLVNYMNGTDYPIANIDPRLPDYVDNGGAAEYKGAVNGKEGKAADGTSANTVFNINSYYFQESSPLVLVSYAEALFLKAEAEFLVNGGTPTSVGSSQAAYDAYKEAIEANMTKIEIKENLMNDYLNDPAIDVTPANLKLEHIMKEKYIALLLNPEIFTDMRRYDFSTNVYKSLDFPENRNPDMPANEWPRRAIYPSGEVDTNTHITQVNFWDRVWWDQ